jgi:hypothetical protein
MSRHNGSRRFLRQLARENIVDATEVIEEMRRRKLAFLVILFLHLLTFGVGIGFGALILGGCAVGEAPDVVSVDASDGHPPDVREERKKEGTRTGAEGAPPPAPPDGGGAAPSGTAAQALDAQPAPDSSTSKVDALEDGCDPYKVAVRGTCEAPWYYQDWHCWLEGTGAPSAVKLPNCPDGYTWHETFCAPSHCPRYEWESRQ